ncbi:MAG TPA: glycine--tRNA ligase subunit beta [Bryobacteraceae bacterium]|nr:glycine--tRNA ligase subunit beta [Bryobacteraceae bacterium]
MNLLVEIGAEEIPDWMIAGALEYLGSAVGNLLKEDSLAENPAVRTDATPRRLVVRAEGIAARKPDTEERVWGPAKSAPPAAVAGFAKKQGVAPDQLEVLNDGKAEKFSYLRKVPGRPATEILAEALPQLILKTPFPKTMYWTGKGGVRFIRPIRWIVALLDNEIIPFEIAGVASGNESSGHRKLGAARFPVTYETFEEKLRDNYVILSAEERRARIRAVATKYKCDNRLLDTLVNLTEWPTPITGSFDPEFLDLPKEVLITVMRSHQKYFSVETPDGNLAPQFVAVTNTDGDPEGLIRHGNERVLKARFNDARFFWDSDQKKKLSERIADLANVTFQAKLGSYLEKTERMDQLVLTLIVHREKPGKALTEEDLREAKVRYAFGPDSPEFYAVRASRLSKTDLTTELVKEFTELQGVVGGLYARAQGEPEEVAVAIYDHYKPVSMEDSIPRSIEGQLLALADKLDTLRGCFKVGLIPSGSKDPFALRRAAQGIVKILIEGKLRLPIQTLCEGDKTLIDFLAERIRHYFREIRGFEYDEINAVLAAPWDDLLDVEERLEAIRQVRPTPNFEPLAASFKRIRNILRQAEFAGLAEPLNEKLLERGPETELYQAFEATRLACRLAPDHWTRMEHIAALRPKVDQFFDKVLVNAPDPEVRRNRLSLLHIMMAEFSTIADFSEIVTAS